MPARMCRFPYRDSGRIELLFRRDGSIDWQRSEEVPILTRQDVQVAEARLRSDHLPSGHGRTWAKKTSSSTGEPLTVTHTTRSSASQGTGSTVSSPTASISSRAQNLQAV